MRVLPLACLLTVIATTPEASRPGGVAYDLTIAGIPIGDAHLSVDVGADAYAVTGEADFGFLFWGGVGAATSTGTLRDGALRPARYRLAYEGVTRPGSVDIEFDGDRAVRWDRLPPMPAEFAEGRLPLRDEHLMGVLDPLSALVIPAPADIAPEALCRRVQPVFSGYTRFDLAFVAADAVQDGAVACRAQYRAVSGHRPDSRGVERMRDPGALQVSLAPVAPGVWGPARVAVATRFGTFEMTRR